MIKLSQTQCKRRGTHLAVSGWRMTVFFFHSVVPARVASSRHIVQCADVLRNQVKVRSNARCIILIDQCFTKTGMSNVYLPDASCWLINALQRMDASRILQEAQRLGYLELSWARLNRPWFVLCSLWYEIAIMVHACGCLDFRLEDGADDVLPETRKQDNTKNHWNKSLFTPKHCKKSKMLIWWDMMIWYASANDGHSSSLWFTQRIWRPSSNSSQKRPSWSK